MNNNKTHQVEKLTIINAKQSLSYTDRQSHSCHADKNPYQHDGRVWIRILIGKKVVYTALAPPHDKSVYFWCWGNYMSLRHSVEDLQ